MILSPSEKDFIKHGILKDIRCDGRQRVDYRQFYIEQGLFILIKALLIRHQDLVD